MTELNGTRRACFVSCDLCLIRFETAKLTRVTSDVKRADCGEIVELKTHGLVRASVALYRRQKTSTGTMGEAATSSGGILRHPRSSANWTAANQRRGAPTPSTRVTREDSPWRQLFRVEDMGE